MDRKITAITCDDGSTIDSNDVDHINITKKNDGSSTYALISKSGKRHPIKADDIEYFIKVFDFRLAMYDPE